MPMTTENQTPDRVNSHANGPQAGWAWDGSPHRGSSMTVQPITPAMVAEAISREDWHFYTDPDGNILVEPWEYDSDIEGGLVFQVDLEGEDRDLLMDQVQCDRHFPLDRTPASGDRASCRIPVAQGGHRQFLWCSRTEVRGSPRPVAGHSSLSVARGDRLGVLTRARVLHLACQALAR